MDPGSNQLKKVRTFHADMAAVRPGAKPEPTVAPAVDIRPKTELPPVMAPVSPQPPAPLPPPKPKALASAPDQAARPQNQSVIGLPENIKHDLGGLAAKPAFDQADRINVMDTDSEVVEGTIITDQKRDRFKLLPAMAEAVQGWFQEGKDAIEDRAEAKRQAIPTVSSLEDRKKVLEKAASKSALAPKDDHQKLAAKLPANLSKQAAKAREAVVIKKKDPAAKPSWSHFEGQGEPVAKAAPATQPVVETEVLTTVAAPVLPPPPKPTPAIPTPAPTPTPPPAAKVEPVEIEIGQKKTAPEERKWRPTPTKKRWRIPRAVSYAALAIVAIGAMGGGAMAALWFFQGDAGLAPTTPNQPIAHDRPAELISRDQTIKLPLPNSRDRLYADLSAHMDATSGIIVFDWTQNGGEALADAKDLLRVLAWQASPAFLRAINEISLGSLGTSPFIVARASSFDTAFGGLLAAEENLTTDLYPLFGDVTAISDDTATSTPTEINSFVDDVIRNHDVRVLKDHLEAEQIVYGFVNQNTVIITTDRAAFTTLVEAVR